MIEKQWLVIVTASVAGLILPVTGSAQGWAEIRTGAATTVLFKVAVPLASFREMTVLEALDRVGPLRVPNVEVWSTQKTGGSVSKNFGPGLSPGEIGVVKGGLRNRKIAAYSLPSIPAEEAAARSCSGSLRRSISRRLSPRPPRTRFRSSTSWRRNLTSAWRSMAARLRTGIRGRCGKFWTRAATASAPARISTLGNGPEFGRSTA